MRAALFLCLASLGACATAGAGGDDIVTIDARPGTIDGATPDGPGVPIDAPPGVPIDAPVVPIDAPMIDAAPLRTITLSQSSSMTITTPNTVTCNSTLGNAENSFYRVFRLSDFAVNTAFTANRIDFAVEEATAANFVSQAIQIRLYTLTGAFALPNLTAIAGQTVIVPDSATLTTMQVTLSPPGVAPAGSTIVAEIFVPNGQAAGDFFFPGSNAAAETGPSYIRAPDCGAAGPVTFASLSHPEVHLILTVSGVY